MWKSLGLEIARDDSLHGGYVARGGIGVELSEVEAELAEGQTPRKLPFVIGSASGTRGLGFAAGVDTSVVDAIDGDPRTSWLVGDFGTSASNPFVAFQFAEAVDDREHDDRRRLVTNPRPAARPSAASAGCPPVLPGPMMPPAAAPSRTHGRSGVRVSWVAGVSDERHPSPWRCGSWPRERSVNELAGRRQSPRSDIVETFHQLSTPELASLARKLRGLSLPRPGWKWPSTG